MYITVLPAIREVNYTTLNDLLDYNPKTGDLVWKERPEHYFPHPRYKTRWDAKWAGKIAGSVFGYKNSPNKYIRICIFKQNFRAHRIVWWMVTGEEPTKDIDHIDHDGLNNRFENLRLVSKKENQKNLSRNKNNTSGVTGVKKVRGKYHAVVQSDNRMIFLGSFDRFEDAVEARKEANTKYGFHENHGE